MAPGFEKPMARACRKSFTDIDLDLDSSPPLTFLKGLDMAIRHPNTVTTSPPASRISTLLSSIIFCASASANMAMIEKTVSTRHAPSPVTNPALCPLLRDFCITRIAIGPPNKLTKQTIYELFLEIILEIIRIGYLCELFSGKI